MEVESKKIKKSYLKTVHNKSKYEGRPMICSRNSIPILILIGNEIIFKSTRSLIPCKNPNLLVLSLHSLFVPSSSTGHLVVQSGKKNFLNQTITFIIWRIRHLDFKNIIMQQNMRIGAAVFTHYLTSPPSYYLSLLQTRQITDIILLAK